MKTKMHILEIGGYHLGFKSISAATAAMTALSKGIDITHDTKYQDFVLCSDSDRGVNDRMRLYTGNVAQPTKKKPLGLPAPKRNTVDCPCCESVAVVRGTECQSCGTYVP